MKFIDDFLNNITMYRLILYDLIALLIVALILSFFSLIPYSPVTVIFSSSIILAVSLFTNEIFSKIYKAPVNHESVYITALILILIVSPIKSTSDFLFLIWVSIWAMASKYIFVINRKHIFNPVAISVVITSIFIDKSASWWIGNIYMFPFVLISGLLIVRKIQRFDLVTAFILTTLIASFSNLSHILFHSPLLFFALFMLTEPLTTPPNKNLRILYGILTGFLFLPKTHIGNVYSTPELALVIGNIFSYLIGPKEKLFLKLKEKIKIAEGLYDFSFIVGRKISFIPGQYMEWTLPHEKIDSRGNRRYFTIASSPTEDHLKLGIKIYNNGSSFKRALMNLDNETEIVGAQLSGDFTLPIDKKQKLVFIAGGIGITPFRSMIKYLVDNNQHRIITLFYSNKSGKEIMYSDVFEKARELGINTVYTLTDKDNLPLNWKGYSGRITSKLIKTEVPDFMERRYYLSGPHNMVKEFQRILEEIGVPKNKIKVDYFPGFV